MVAPLVKLDGASYQINTACIYVNMFGIDIWWLFLHPPPPPIILPITTNTIFLLTQCSSKVEDRNLRISKMPKFRDILGNFYILTHQDPIGSAWTSDLIQGPWVKRFTSIWTRSNISKTYLETLKWTSRWNFVGRLQEGDQILSINGESAKHIKNERYTFWNKLHKRILVRVTFSLNIWVL